ncbi:uncharacterized protein [Rutidosis leptorrhynchoides]|uniref:uncharacterized protein n=1 Tax=Rutidosis leptorrhynchoides TaxID=125765 RepID=UPI003A991195
MNILSINSYGSKVFLKRQWIRELCSSSNIQFLGLQETKMTRLKLSRLKSIWGNHTFDYAVTLSRGVSGGIVPLWDPNSFVKSHIWCDDHFVIVKGRWLHFDLEVFMDAQVFNDFIDSMSLYELPLEDLKGVVLPRGYSDHSPVLLYQDNVDFGPTYFKIFDSWFSRGDFDVVVRSLWHEVCVSSTSDVVAKLRLLKGKLKCWIHSTRMVEAIRLQEVAKKIDELDIIIDSGSATTTDIDTPNGLFHERDELLKFKALYALQKSNIKWDVEGDENSKFFHCSLKHKRGQKHIQGLMFDGNWVTNPVVIKNKFFEFFKPKFEDVKSGATFGHINPQYVLTSTEANDLEQPFDNEEIKSAVWDCGSSKAPGPDGYSFCFIKQFWDILESDICRDVRSFFETSSLPRGANSTFFSLIPKVSNPVVVTDFRPISLVGCFYKIITKLLMNLLARVIDKLIM